MTAAVVAYAFGVPNTLRSNRLIAGIASAKASSLGIPVYTQRDVLPLARDVVVELTEEEYPKRVPTLRITRGAVRWARQNRIDELWLCAAAPHLARVRRDVEYVLKKEGVAIRVRICDEVYNFSDNDWFCHESAQADTRLPLLWAVRDTVLRSSPTWLYSYVAS